MATLREIKRRIDSVKSTKHITKAMKMVAAAKLRKAQQQLAFIRPFADELGGVIGTIARQPVAKNHDYFAHQPAKRVCYVLITADRGLCGSYNTNLIRLAEEKLSASDSEKSFVAVGKKGYDHFRRHGIPLAGKYIDFFSKLSYNDAVKIAKSLMIQFDKKRFDHIYIIYNTFTTIVQQTVCLQQFLPILPARPIDSAPVTTVFEPHPINILNKILPMSLHHNMYRILLESFTAEQSARMTAMETASDNADEMIKKLVLYYNKARQTAITTELTEIVGGAEALKGYKS
ncbi:ATP synthase F1 subunit gamma [candidate division KSB1 bacterium]|nr:ATP synthase F1 subunit gamma [candidate division KSB1 bacterium]RQW02561.1 MAG: ATP synthase F1 subunit gamma [candidate division KSB1 bacterium]